MDLDFGPNRFYFLNKTKNTNKQTNKMSTIKHNLYILYDTTTKNNNSNATTNLCSTFQATSEECSNYSLAAKSMQNSSSDSSTATMIIRKSPPASYYYSNLKKTKCNQCETTTQTTYNNEKYDNVSTAVSSNS